MASSVESYLIIGAGIFGASTALRLKQEKPWANITLIDRTPFPNPSSASHDVAKIIRDDYADPFLMELASEAQREWRDNPLYQRHYHQTGFAFAENIGTGKATIKNYRTLGLDIPAIMLSLGDARRRWHGVFENANWDGAEEIYFNKQSGYADAEEALRDTIRLAISKGVTYLEATVSTLILDNETCTGVSTDNGNLYADHTLLCTGAFTAKLLADTAPTNEKLQVDRRLVAVGAVSATATIAPEFHAQFKDAPVFFIGLPHAQGESMPVNSKGLVKFNYDTSFTRMQCRPYSDQKISVPPSMEKYSTWGPGEDIPKGLRNEINTLARIMYGDKVRVVSYKICWDARTPNQDFLISKHPHCKNLYIATGGSFHGFKFLPTIGKSVVKMMDGTLEEVYRTRWNWDRKKEGAACEMYAPTRDIKDIDGSNLDGI